MRMRWRFISLLFKLSNNATPYERVSQARAGKCLPWVGEAFVMQVSRACFNFMVSDISEGSVVITECG